MPILPGEEVLVGENYQVRGRRGCWRRATVLDKRRGENGRVELYVHFDGDDRRLDHWLDSSRLKFRNKINKRIAPVYEMREKRMRKAKENSPNNASLDYTEVLEEQHIEVTKVKYIEVVRYGEFEMDTWYVSPYPDEYGRERYLFICDKCFLYMRQERAFKMHLSTCNVKHPPGREIYVDTDEKIAVYEVDGEKEKLFCQCLCLFAKLFMDHKTIYFDVTAFLFYVSTCNVKHPPGREIYVDTDEKIAVYEVDGEKEKLFCQCLCLFAKLFMDHKTIYFDVTAFLFYVVCQLRDSGKR
ncbi:hypothetical protein COOONC_08077 [Cooperia oncophora]